MHKTQNNVINKMLIHGGAGAGLDKIDNNIPGYTKMARRFKPQQYLSKNNMRFAYKLSAIFSVRMTLK